jgi:type VI secretion system secreted protein VgrG
MNQALAPAGYTRLRTLRKPDVANFLHCAIFLPQGRVLDSQTFRLVRFEGQDSVSELFEYQLELHGNSSVLHGAALEYETLLGRPLTVGVQRPAPHQPSWPDDIGYSNEEMTARFRQALDGGGSFPELVLFNGIVASFAMEQRGVYRIVMKPALHRLTLTNDYKLYERIAAVDLVRQLLKSHQIDYVLDALLDQDNQFQARRQNWMQAGESDFEFLRRLMAKAHVYFYFVHDGRSHKLVLANRPAYRPVFANDRPLRYTFTGADELGLAQEDVIFQYSYQRSMTSSSVRGVYTRQRACWEDDPIGRLHSYSAASSAEPGALPFTQYRIYQYGGSAAQADEHVAAASAAMQAAAQVFSGASYCAQFRVGHQFRVLGEVDTVHGPLPVRPALDGQRFVLTQVKIEASADGSYQNQFQSAPATALIGPFSMQETQQGSVLAEVVGRSGDMAPPDWRYYASGCFDPAAATLSDGGAETLKVQGVFVRLSTDAPDAPPSFVKLAPHMQTVPEPGVTVVVARAQDEWELPEVQSILHSDGTRVVMRSGWTAGSHVGSSYSTSYGDGKSLRFGLNSAAPLGFASAHVDAVYAGGGYREASYAQGASYSYSCAESRAASPSDDAELYGKYPGAADLLSASESFGSNYSRHHGQVVSSYSKIGTSYTRSETGRSESDSIVTGDSISKTLHHGDVDSDTTILGDSSSTSTIAGTNSSVATHAISLSQSNTGISTAANVTGVSTTTSATGVSTEISAVGMHSTVSVTGVHNTFSHIESSNTVELNDEGVYFISKTGQTGAEVADMDVVTIEVVRIYL